jgi:hypothetical protein
MKQKIYTVVLFCVMILAAACEKHDYAAGTLSPITSLEDVRALYKGADVVLNKENLMSAAQITGVVISNPDSGNVAAGVVVLQNKRRNKTRGIILELPSAATYKAGDSLLVTVTGLTLTKVKGSLRLKGLTDAGINKISAGNVVTATTVSSYNITLKPGEYESTLVQISAGTINPAPLPGVPMSGDHSVVNGADSIILHTETTAAFAANELPASANFTGIVYINETATGAMALQVWPRTYGDITDRIAPVDPNGPKLGKFPVVITGYVNDAKGADGNYEYFQFKATRDIDFEQTPMAVVTCTNAGTAAPNVGKAPAGGWATGGGRTYKFNLTSGSVTKGQFFYVGGSNKRINGPNSTDISAAKWIRTIAYVTNDGDGFGSSSSGLLPNSGNAGGIAIFEGTNITETSVPVDAILFGGSGTGTIYNADTNTGYRTVDSDHYAVVDPATGTAQPFFLQGTNTYIIPHQTPADQGIFVKLNGVFNTTTKTWVSPRGYDVYLMSPTSSTAEIESGTTLFGN